MGLFVLPFRPRQSAHAYRSIWWEEGSPLIVLSRRLLDAVRDSTRAPVGLAMRYGRPDIETELLKLAKFPNVGVKATGAPGYSSEAYPFPKMHTYLEQIFDSFGPRRMFWGTDITKMPCSWRQCVTMFSEELPWLNGSDRALVMGEAVCAWWEWDRNSLA